MAVVTAWCAETPGAPMSVRPLSDRALAWLSVLIVSVLLWAVIIGLFFLLAGSVR